MERAPSPVGGRAGVCRHDIWELASLPAVRSVIDKFLILCLRDNLLRRFFEECNLYRLKQNQTEVLLAALGLVRGAFVGDRLNVDIITKKRGRPASLKALKALTEEKLERFRSCLATAMEEALSERVARQGRSSSCRAEAMRATVALLLQVDETLLVELLPRGEVRGDATKSKAKPEPPTRQRTVLGAEIAPLNVPLLRRQQAFAVGLFMYGPLVMIIWSFWHVRATGLLILLGRLWYLAVSQRPAAIGRLWRALRRNLYLRMCAQYFPAALINAEPMHVWDRSKAYMIGYNPHGLFSLSAALSFATDVLGWHEKFYGLEPRIGSEFMGLRIPILSDILSRMGFAEVSKERTLLDVIAPGRALIVKLGNRREAVDAAPGQYVLTLRSRGDFFRAALQTGAHVVPCFAFGETRLFEYKEAHGFVRDVQSWIERRVGIFVPIFYGRSMFTYNVGLMPHRRPLFTVVGSPIPVERVADPSDEQVEALREDYIACLRKLFEEWQPQCEPDSNAQLIII
mmetsp:Transcript_104766/g.305904  ORF Transcript_104766/g.305904 Transcript_104766/m.305904 type:complete len:514 (-) Transcript_104766:350-1891(-)